MRDRQAKFAAWAVAMISSLRTPLSQAQEAGATLSGKMTDSSAAVPNAKVSIKNLETGQAADMQTDATGRYKLQKLAPGDPEVTVPVKGFAPKTDKVTFIAGATPTRNPKLAGRPGLGSRAEAS